MARERWFFAKDNRRMGPFPRRQLVESLLALSDPRACLVWRHGLPAWTPAADVPEVERLLAPFAPAKEPEPAPPPAAETSQRFEARSIPGARPLPGVARARPRMNPLVLYGGIAGAVLVVGLLAWLLWPAPPPEEPEGGGSSGSSGGSGGITTTGPTGGGSPHPGGPASPRAGGPGFTGFVDQETDLPTAELRKLRGVAGWAGDKLTVTLYNGSSWRITEIQVRTSRLEKDHFIDSNTPSRLLPGGGAAVDAAVGELLKKVAPDRKKAGVNPADTGPFEGVVGPQPQAYRWKIDGARGYPPRSGS